MLETYKKVKKLEHKIETDQYLESEIESSEPLSTYLKEHSDDFNLVWCKRTHSI